MKTIYLCEKPTNIRNVFGTDARVYCKAELLAEPEKFRETQYVFSSWGMPVMSEEEIGACLPNMKAVFYGAGTVQAFARPFLNRGIKVFSAWAANAVPVAEYTVAQIVLANKGFFQSCRIGSGGDRAAAAKFFRANPGNFGAKVGIIGAGTIGKLVIGMLKSYNLTVLVFDPFLPEEKAAQLGVTKCQLDTLFRECHVVSNHLANNAQTKGMLKKEHFAAMQPYATFLNTGRGAQVVEADLIEILQSRPDLTAVLDVTYPEPPAPDSPFFALPNCFLTPHMAGSAGDEVRRMGKFMEEEYGHFLAGRPCRYEVTLEMLKTMA